MVLKLIVERIKRIYKGTGSNKLLLNTLSEKLMNINNSSLSEPRFYKLRSKLY